MAVNKTYVDLDGGLIDNLINWRHNPLSTVERTNLGSTLTPVNVGLFAFDTTLLEGFYWSGTSWVSSGGSGGGTVWGSISGTISNQTDLKNALNLKANVSDLPVPGGADTQIQFNNNGVFAGDPNFTWNNGLTGIGDFNWSSTDSTANIQLEDETIQIIVGSSLLTVGSSAIELDGSVILGNSIGQGDKMLVTDNSGTISTQSIPTSPVQSVFGRTGNVVAANGDYNTSQVTENTNLYFTGARVLTSLLTGYVSGSGVISSTDSVLSAIQKLNGNIGALVTGVSSFNTRTGAITLSSGDVTGALGFTPYNATNPSGFISGINSSMVTTALGFTPYNATNPSGFITSAGAPVQSVSNSDSSLTISPTTGAVVASLNLGHANTWTIGQTISYSSTNLASIGIDVNLTVPVTSADVMVGRFQGTNNLISGNRNAYINFGSGTSIYSLVNDGGGQLFFKYGNNPAAIGSGFVLGMVNDGRMFINGNLLIGSTTYSGASAILSLVSTTKGFLPPVMTTTQKNAIATQPEGLVIYDNVLHTLSIYDSTAWLSAGHLSGSASSGVTGVTAFTVAIGSTLPNNTYKVNITPTSALSAALFYVSAKTTTTFTVTYLSALTGTVTFDWSLFP